MTDSPSAKSTEDIEAITVELDQLKRDREGVAMFLVLEDLATDGEPASGDGPASEGTALAGLATHYAGLLLKNPQEPTEREVAGVLEVLAAAHFQETAL